MKRDMDLCRKILFAIEDQYEDSDIINLQVEGYRTAQVVYHCKLLEDAGLIENYYDSYGDDELEFFCVGALTWEGHEYLDKIRSDTVWNQTKEVITKKGLPMVLDTIKQVATAVISSMTEGAITAMLK